MLLKIGDKIPDFSIDAYHHAKICKVRSSHFKEKWLVVAFYPADFTFVCPTELEELADNYGKFTSMGAEILSISVDSPIDHKKWHDSYTGINKIEYPMGSGWESIWLIRDIY